MKFFTDKISNILYNISNAVGKFKQRFNAVGKHISTFSSALTPESTSIPNLNPLEKTAAKISNVAYDTNRPNIIDNYTYDPELSNSLSAIYYNNQNVIIGFRGTSKIEDIKTDYNILKGTTNDQQFREAQNIYNKVKSKYPNLPIITTGHSKGGSLALYINDLYNTKAIVFNAGVGFNFLKSNPNANNVTLHVIKGDPISALSGLSKLGNLNIWNSIYKNPSPIQAHLLGNFISSP